MSMDSPVLIVVPPTPLSTLGTRSRDPRLFSGNDDRRKDTLDTAFSSEVTSNSKDTIDSSHAASTPTQLARSSSENTAVNIYSMYGGAGTERDSYASSNGTPAGSNQYDRHEPTRRASKSPPVSGHGYSDKRSSIASSGMNSARESVYETSTQSPIYPTPPIPGSRNNSESRHKKRDHLDGRDGYDAQGQYIEPGRVSPAVLINPPPRRSSRQSMRSNNLNLGGETNGNKRLSTSSSRRHSTSSRLSPTRVSTDPTTSATSSSATSASKNPLPSPLIPMAPSPAPNEDPDSYFVRATYAALDVSGVKGDGYEEGEELTRARLGSGRGNLPSPSPDIAKRLVLGPKELNEREVELLGQVDRYGFFQAPSENRIVKLLANPLRTGLSMSKTATSTAPENPPQLTSLPTAVESVEDRRREDRRIAKWGRMLVPAVRDSGANIAKWRIEERKERKLQERVFKGIPDRWRAAAWYTLMEQRAAVGASEKDVMRAETLAVKYRDDIDQPSIFDVQIDLDVPRTISGHVMFKTRYGMGQRSMFHVLHSFSLFCSTCGYCQGMGPLAATLLSYLEPEKVYTSLVRLHDHYDMHATFAPGFPGLLEAFYVQERIMQRMLPGVYAVFKQNMISTTAYAVKWYITLFANTVSFQTQLRLWDVYFLEGGDVMVLMSVAILWAFKDNFLAPKASFESMLGILSSFFVVEDDDALFSWLRKAMLDRRLRRDMASWRAEWKELVRTEKEKDVLL